MNEKYRSLWERIERFELDDLQASVTFSDKLSHEQKWSKTFTHQAISEYKRFMFLCVALPQGASPSKTVDEVWHMHLTYTKSYWIDFCRDTLGQDVHHHPSTGDTVQDTKHKAWYEDTLLQYERYFSMEPPEHIWPRSVIVPEEGPSVSSKTKWMLYAGTVGIPWIVCLVFYRQWHMFALRGPQFLGFYIYAALGALLLHNWYRNRLTKLRQKYLQARVPNYLSTYQVADFLHGRESAVNAAIVNLVDWGKLAVHEKHSYVVQSDPANPGDEYRINPMLTLLRLNKEGDMVLHWKLLKDLRYNHEFSSELRDMSILRLELSAYAPLMWLLLLGVARCVQGIYNDRPIAYLLLQMIFLALVFWGVKYLKDLSFKDWFKDLVKAKYEQQWKMNFTVSQKFSLFGEKVLYGLPIVFLVAKQFMEPPYDGAGGSGSGGSSDGGSSSCGSSDGGSSCGGGGCGGCGGGGD